MAAECTWAPQDLTANNAGCPPIPDDDYIKRYQSNPELWPVEFFVVAYRRIKIPSTQKKETQILVRRSANGTSKFGLGTGVPATRWIPAGASPPRGYEAAKPEVTFDACNYPEFPEGEASWSYAKIDIRKDAFSETADVDDPDLQRYASRIRDELRTILYGKTKDGDALSAFERNTYDVVQKILGCSNSIAAIQGSLRMSGLFAKIDEATEHRFVDFEDAPPPSTLAESARIYTMFPQMPCPMPLPSTNAEELRDEIESRPARMLKSGRDPHKDRYGRVHTHISTNNVSNTIHGVYLPFDVTKTLGLAGDTPPAFDLFGTTEIEREWVSLIEMGVLEADGASIGTADTKPTFISGFIVRQLVKEGIIEV
ncbi:hypothetical protein ACHAXT_011190 [Thalassiosira profunda]